MKMTRKIIKKSHSQTPSPKQIPNQTESQNPNPRSESLKILDRKMGEDLFNELTGDNRVNRVKILTGWFTEHLPL
jgi:hypothetical protein